MSKRSEIIRFPASARNNHKLSIEILENGFCLLQIDEGGIFGMSAEVLDNVAHKALSKRLQFLANRKTKPNLKVVK
jgi:hypothetical protein